MKKGLFFCVLIVMVLFALPVQAGFIYDIPVQDDQLEVRPDGGVFLVRYFEFRVANTSTDAGTAIWAGLPTSGTRITKVTDASGQSVNYGTNFSGGSFVVTLEGFKINPGEAMGFYIEAEIPQFIYRDSQNEGYVTLEYTPGWWDSAVLEQEIAVILPPGVTKEEVRTGAREWDAFAQTEEGRAVIYFKQHLAPNERLTVNIGFPAEHLSIVIPEPVTPAYPQPVYPSPGPTMPGFSTGPDPGAIIGLFFAAMIVMGFVALLSGRQDYKAPFAAMEGVGINMDLSPIEAAVLLRTEPRRVLTMGLFELLRNNNVQVEYENPLTLVQTSPMGLSGFRLCMYEALEEKGTFDQTQLLSCYKELVQSVIDKTKPFCRKETEAYYKGKVADNWERLQEAEDAEKAFSTFDDSLFWLLLDEEFETKVEQALPREWQVFPQNYWLWMHFGSHHHGMYWPFFYRTFNNVGQNAWPNQDQYAQAQTQLFKPIIVPPSGSGPRQGGGGGFSGPSCACACACVSCACACACAGGGGCT